MAQPHRGLQAPLRFRSLSFDPGCDRGKSQMLSVRLYESGDWPAVRESLVELQDFERTYEARLRPGEEVAESYWKFLIGKCRAESGRVFVADLDDTVVGFVAVQAKVRSDEPDEERYDYAYVSDLCVLARCRGQGIGRALLEAAERFAVESGASILRIDVLAGNESAARLYRGAGFEPRIVQLEKTLA